MYIRYYFNKALCQKPGARSSLLSPLEKHSAVLYQVSEPLPQLPQLRTFPPISHVFVTAPPPIHVPSNDIVINFENKNTSFLEIARQLNVRFGSRILKGCDLQSSRSCKGRCGTRERNKRLKCYCDGLCQDLGDCCYDYFNRYVSCPLLEN